MDGVLLDLAGYNHEIFLDLSKRERLEYRCQLCRLILNKPQQCFNGHLYCKSCISEWTHRGNKTCPFCGAGATFNENNLVRGQLDIKYVRCESSLCKWKGRLERLEHHVKETHNTSTESVASTERDTLSTEDRLGNHKTTEDVDRIQHRKKEFLHKRIRKIERQKNRDNFERDSALTLPLDSNTATSRWENVRPLTEIIDGKSHIRLPRIEWKLPHQTRDSFYQRLQDVESAKQTKREMIYRKMEQMDERKQRERNNIYRRIHDMERKREDNRQTTDNRIQQIEQKMRAERAAFEKRFDEKDRQNKEGHEILKRRISVIKVKMKR